MKYAGYDITLYTVITELLVGNKKGEGNQSSPYYSLSNAFYPFYLACDNDSVENHYQ